MPVGNRLMQKRGRILSRQIDGTEATVGWGRPVLLTPHKHGTISWPELRFGAPEFKTRWLSSL